MTTFHEKRLAALPSVAVDPVRRYTCGWCGEFAAALHALTGWPLVTVTDCFNSRIHAAVIRPDGKYADVRGVQTEEELLATWEKDGWGPCRVAWVGPVPSGFQLLAAGAVFTNHDWPLHRQEIPVAMAYITTERPELLAVSP